MCGISGFIDFTNSSVESDVKIMSDQLQHRGPDGEGSLFLETERWQLGFGHRRLSIIDLSEAASQPMQYEGLHIIFNGEIYNYNEIREELLRKGHSFNSHSDTEVILHSIKEWGMDAIKQWRGMFAIVLYDENLEQIMCIRDRAGVKPFYYYWDNNHFIFGSELKAINAHHCFKKEINKDAVQSFLQYGYIPTPHCIYQNTYKLQPGHYIRLDLITRKFEEVEYWNVYDYYNTKKTSISINDAVSETEKILETAFQYRMVADVPVGVFLSGGFDSTCVTALLQKNSTSKIKTFTIGSFDERYNEAPYAKEIANYLGTDHTEYYCTPQEALNIIPELPYYYDEPFADSSAIPTILVSRLARKKVTVALSADAGDEIFAGYTRYKFLMSYNAKFKGIPRGIRNAMTGVLNNISSNSIPILRKTYNFHSRYEKLKAVMEDPTPARLMKNSVQVFSDSEVKKVVSDEVKELSTKLVTNALTKEFYDPLSYMLAVDYQTYMNDDILHKVDRATMSTSLEGREPFLDQEILEWVAKLPSEYKLRGTTKKYLLKEIVYKHIPKQLMDRPKMGFSIPVDSWLSVELKDMVMDYLNENKLKHGLFDKDYVLDLRDQFFSGKKNLYLKIWTLCMFQMWYYKWM